MMVQKTDSSQLVSRITVVLALFIIIFSISGVVSANTANVENETGTTEVSPKIDGFQINDKQIVEDEDVTVSVSGEADSSIEYTHKLEVIDESGWSDTVIAEKSLSLSDDEFDTEIPIEDIEQPSGDDAELSVRLTQEDTVCFAGCEETDKTDPKSYTIHDADSADPRPEIEAIDDEFTSQLCTEGVCHNFESEDGPEDIPQVNPEQEVTLRLYVRNTGGEAGDFSAIQMQFPEFDETNDDKHVEATSDSFYNILEIAPGDTVYNADDSESSATSWQVEWTDSRYGWGSDSVQMLEVTFTPQESGAFPVYYRSTLTDDVAQEGEENKFTTPSWSLQDDPDQDGYDMHTIEIDVERENEPPSADAGGPYAVDEGETIELDSDESSDPDGQIEKTEWELVSGEGSVEDNTYSAPEPNTLNSDGEAEVRLTVTDDDGTTDSDTATVNINANQPPNADAGGTYSVEEGESVELDSSGSSDTDGSIDQTEWTVMDGPGSIENGAYVAPDSVDSDTEVTVELTVMDDDGATDTDTAIVSVDANEPPSADAGGPYTVNENERVSLDSSESSDPDGEIVDREWAVTEGPGEIDSGEFVATGDITEDTTATVELTVTDDDGATDSDTDTVEIDANEPPTADAGGSYFVEEGESVELDSSGSSDSDGQIADRSWEVVDGPGDVNDGTYTAPDSLEDDTTATVELTVTDDDGATTTDTATVTIGAVEEPFFDVSIDSVNDPVQEGETLEVDTKIQNLGDESDTQSVRLFADGTEVDSADVTLDGGATVTKSLSYETESGDADSVILRVETDDTSKERTAAVTAESEAEAFFDVSIDNINDPVDVGDELTVTGTIENTGESTGTQDIEASIGGGQIGSEQVTLDPGESRTVSMSAETDADDAPSVLAELQSANDTATQEATVESEEDGGSAAERSIDRTTAQPGDTVEVTVSMEFEEATAPALSEGFDTALAEVERVDESPPALFAGPKDNNTEYVAAWDESEGDYEATYRVTIPEAVDTEDEIQIDGTVTLEDTGEAIEISGEDTIEIIDDPLVAYANDNGIVTTDGMIDAFGDWQSGEVSVDVLLEVFSAWQTGEQVG